MSKVTIRVQRDGTIYVKHDDWRPFWGPTADERRLFGAKLAATPEWVQALVRQGVVTDDLAASRLAEDLRLLLESLGHDVTIEALT